MIRALLGAIAGDATEVTETWEHFSNDACYRQKQEVEVAEEDEEEVDEWRMLRIAAEDQDLRFRVSGGWIYIGREAFRENEDGVNEAWEYIAA